MAYCFIPPLYSCCRACMISDTKPANMKVIVRLIPNANHPTRYIVRLIVIAAARNIKTSKKAQIRLKKVLKIVINRKNPPPKARFLGF